MCIRFMTLTPGKSFVHEMLSLNEPLPVPPTTKTNVSTGLAPAHDTIPATVEQPAVHIPPAPVLPAL